MGIFQILVNGTDMREGMYQVFGWCFLRQRGPAEALLSQKRKGGFIKNKSEYIFFFWLSIYFSVPLIYNFGHGLTLNV